MLEEERPPDEDVSDYKTIGEEEEEEKEEEELDAVEMKKSRTKALQEFRFRVGEAIRGDYLISRKTKRKAFGTPPLENQPEKRINRIVENSD